MQRRDRFSKTYATETAGIFRKVVSGTPVHFQDEARGRAWTDIDSRLQTTPSGRFRNGRNAFGLELAQQPSSTDLLRLSRGAVSVGWGVQGARRPSKVDRGENAVVLREVLPAVDVEVTSLPDGVREDLILTSRSAPRTMLFPLTLSGVTASISPEGHVLFTDPAGTVVGHTPKAWMYDSLTDPQRQLDGASSAGADFRIVAHQGGQALELTLDGVWLDDPARVFPVRVDPSYLWYQPEAQADDTYTAQHPDGDRSMWDRLVIGHKAGEISGRYRRAYMHFDVGTGYTVTNASLNMHATLDPECRSTPTDVHRITSAWTGSSVINLSRAPLHRSTPDATISPFNYGAPQCTTGGNSTSSSALAATVKGWVDGTIPNHGLMLKARDESDTGGASYREYFSHQGGAVNSLQRPFLEVFYNGNPQTPTQLAPPASPKQTTTTPQLSGLFDDLDGDGGRLEFEVYPSTSTASSARIAAGSGSSIPTNTTRGTSSWTVPSTAGLQQGASYQWRARAVDNLAGASAWTAFQRFTINTPPGQPGDLRPVDGTLTLLTPTLSATYTDANGDSGRVDFAVFNAAGTRVAGGAGTSATSGARSSWTVPSGVLSDGQSYTWDASAFDGLQRSATPNPRVGFTVKADQTNPTEPTNLRSTSGHGPLLTSADRTVDIAWDAGTDAGSGVAGYSVTFNQSKTQQADASVDTAGLTATSPTLADGVWYAHVRTVDRSGNLSGDVLHGPYLIGEATLADALLPDSPVAQSNEMGLEQSLAFDTVDTGTGTGFVNLRTGNLVTQQDLFTVPGQGLNTVGRLTHNSQLAGRDDGVGTGWSLSVTDLEGGVEGPLEDLTDAAVTDVDINRDVVLGLLDTATGRIVQDLTYTGAQATGDVLEFTDGDGTTHRFVRDRAAGRGSRWISPPGVDLKVREVTEPIAGTTARTVVAYELIRPDGVVYTATPLKPEQLQVAGESPLALPVWRITKVTDRSGNALTYTHRNFDGVGINKTRLVAIEHNRYPGTPVVTFDYRPFTAGADNTDAGTLRSITTLPGLVEGGRSYTRRIDLDVAPGSHRLRSITENAHTATQDGQAVDPVTQARRTTSFTYHEPNGTLASATGGRADGGATTFAYTAGTPAGGAKAVPQLTRVTDRAGSPWTWSYTPQAAGKTQTVATRPVEGTQTSATTYLLGARGPVNDTDDPRIAGGNIERVTDAGNDTGSVSTTHTWYANKLTSTRDGAGALTEFRYNDLGLLTKSIAPPPNAAGTTEPGAPTTPVESTLTYRQPAGFGYDGCTQAADDTQTPRGERTVTNAGMCSLVLELERVLTAANIADQKRAADFRYDTAGRMTQVIERADGNTTASSDPQAADRTTRFGYYDKGGLKSIDGSRPDSDVRDITRYGDGEAAYGGYDRSGQPRTLVDADGKTKTFAYSPYGMVLSVTDRDGRATLSRYDERDNLLSATVPGGATTDYRYDGNDNKTDELGPVRIAGGVSYRPTTTTVYDRLDRTIEVRAPGEDEKPGATTGKTVTITSYFADGTVRWEDGPLPGEADRTFYAYHPNRSVKTVDAPAATGSRAVTDSSYDTVGRLVTTTAPVADAAGNRPKESITYTPSGDAAVTARTSPAGAAGNLDQVVRQFFNAHGEPIVTTGPREVGGQTARQLTRYDSFGQPVRTERLVGKDAVGTDRYLVSETGYDLAGNTVRTTQPTGNGGQLESLYTFDALNRLAAQTKDPVNPDHTVTYAYNGEGQQTRREDKTAAGALLRRAESFYNPDNTKRAETITTFDPAVPADQRTMVTCNTRPGGASGYDVEGNLLYTRTVRGPEVPAGTDGCAAGVLLREQELGYDDRDWNTTATMRVREPASGSMISRSQRMTYHANGSKASLVHNDGSSDFPVNYGISPAGWEERLTDWRGRSSTAGYLPSGDVTRHALGAPSGGAAVATADSTYRPDGSIASLAWTVGGQTVRSHTGITYDTGGLRTGETVSVRQPKASSNQTGAAAYRFDLLDRLTGFTSPHPFDAAETRQPSTAYTLDDGGNITRELVTVPAAGTLSPGRTMTDITSTFTGGRLDRRVSKQTVADLTDPVDLITTTETYAYNSLGEETRRQATDSYAGTLPSPITDTTSSTATRYDSAGRTARSDQSATSAQGTPQAEVDKANADVDYVYDSADRVISRVETKAGVASTTLHFYAGTSGSLIEETDGAGKTKTRYLLDGEGESQAQQTYKTNPDGTSTLTGEKWSWLLHDAVGNTATVVDDTGAVVEQKAFDPYGKPEKGGSGKTDAPDAPTTTLGFQSARTDEATGRVMLGQRQYDPTTARFTTPDVYIAGMLDLQLGTDSLTGNRYLFAGANPLAFYEDGHGPFGRLKKLAKRAMPALQFVPVVSTAIDLASAATGRNFYEGGRKMRGAERLAMLGGAAVGLVPGVGPAARAGLAVAKGVKKGRAARKAENAASCPISNSFLPATLVLLADGGSKPIEDIEIGDIVLATDPETGETVGKPVTDVIEGSGLKHLVDITVQGDTDGPLVATDGHPFWVAGQGWTDADDLAVGDLLRQADGDLIPVTAIRTYDVPNAIVHNLTVADIHTYHVTAGEPVLVHNCGGLGINARTAENAGLNNILGGMYKSTDKYGGGTAGALRQEARTGTKVKGRDHRSKAQQTVRALDRVLAGKRGPLSARDKYAAMRHRADLLDALRRFAEKQPRGYRRSQP